MYGGFSRTRARWGKGKASEELAYNAQTTGVNEKRSQTRASPAQNCGAWAILAAGTL
jgi:hypothetical protein